MATPTTDELPRLGRYQVLNKLAQGGMAEIFLGKAIGVMGFERLVAIKLIHSQLTRDSEFVKMFIDEARIAMHLQHRNIVQVLDLDRAGDTYFIAMEYVHGCNLYEIYERIAQKGRWVDLPLALYIVAEVCKGLHFAHTRTTNDGRPLGIVHRDISPQNVLLSFEGEVKITDFGIAKAAERLHVTTPGIVKGKYAYMAPEILKEKPVDGRADVFAAGVLLYELLVGENPFAGSTPVQTIENVLQKRVPAPSQRGAMVSAELDRIALQAIAKSPEERYRTAAELAEALTEHGLNLTTARRDIASGDATVSALLHELFPEKAKRAPTTAGPGGVQLPMAAVPPPGHDTKEELLDTPRAGADVGDRSTDPENSDSVDSTLLSMQAPDRPAIRGGSDRYSPGDEPATALDLEGLEARRARDLTDPVKMDFEPPTDRRMHGVGGPGGPLDRAPKIVGPTGDYAEEDTLLSPDGSGVRSALGIGDQAQPRFASAGPAPSPMIAPRPPTSAAAPPHPVAPVAFPPPQVAQKPASNFLLWLGLGLVLLAIAAVGSVLIIKRSPSVVPVQIVSDPPGAKVTINGEVQNDPTPIEAYLPVGDTHAIEIVRPGYRAFRREVRALEGVTARIDAELEAITGTIFFKVEPHDAELSVNGVERGKVPSQLGGILVGQDLVLRLARQGYEPHHESVRLTEEAPSVTVTVKLRRR